MSRSLPIALYRAGWPAVAAETCSHRRIVISLSDYVANTKILRCSLSRDVCDTNRGKIAQDGLLTRPSSTRGRAQCEALFCIFCRKTKLDVGFIAQEQRAEYPEELTTYSKDPAVESICSLFKIAFFGCGVHLLFIRDRPFALCRDRRWFLLTARSRWRHGHCHLLQGGGCGVHLFFV